MKPFDASAHANSIRGSDGTGRFRAQQLPEPTLGLTDIPAAAEPEHPNTKFLGLGLPADADDAARDANRSILLGTARTDLAERFAQSGLSIDEVAAKVGMSPRLAGRLLAGKETLTEGNVSAYFRAMSG